MTVRKLPWISLPPVTAPIPPGKTPPPAAPPTTTPTTTPPGNKRFYGSGLPGTIIGAQPGDEYLDTDTGDLYVLR